VKPGTVGAEADSGTEDSLLDRYNSIYI
jgi:hypothetical protein